MQYTVCETAWISFMIVLNYNPLETPSIHLLTSFALSPIAPLAIATKSYIMKLMRDCEIEGTPA